MLKKDKITEVVMGIVSETGGIKKSEIKLESDFKQDLGFDSLDAVETAFALEEHFGIEIPDEDADRLTTVGMVIDYLCEKVKD